MTLKSLTIKSFYRALLLSLSVSSFSIGKASLLLAETPTHFQDMVAHSSVAEGQITFSTPNPNTLRVDQTTPKGIINWDHFDVRANEHVIFHQPSSDSITLNRVTGESPSEIQGRVSAENGGQVWFTNGAGVLIGRNAQIDVGSIVATTGHISDVDFMKGNYKFKEPLGAGKIIHEGIIRVATRGLAALVGSNVSQNGGVVVGQLARVVIGKGSVFTLNFDGGDPLITFEVPPPFQTSLNVSGTINAPGGSILITTAAAHYLLANMVNMDGIKRGQRICQENGIIRVLEEDAVNLKGAHLSTAGQTGGSVQIESNGTTSLSHTAINASSDKGQGGSVKVLGAVVRENGLSITAKGPKEGGTILVGGSFRGKDKRVPSSEAVFLGPKTRLIANATEHGSGGTVGVFSRQRTVFKGTIEAKGGTEGGNGGKADISSLKTFDSTGAHFDLSGPSGKSGTLSYDPKIITVVIGGGAYTDNLYEDAPATTVTISPGNLSGAGADIILGGNTSVTVTNAINLTNHAIRMEAGQSVLINAGVTTNNGNITLIANDSDCETADRNQVAPTAGEIVATAPLDAGTGAISATVKEDWTAGLVTGTSGSITLNALTGSTLQASTPHDITLAGVANLSSSVTLNAGRDLFFSEALTGGSLNATASGTLSINDDITVSSGITLSAGGDLTADVGVIEADSLTITATGNNFGTTTPIQINLGSSGKNGPSLYLGSTHGGYFVGTINGQGGSEAARYARLQPGASGNFYVNGTLVTATGASDNLEIIGNITSNYLETTSPISLKDKIQTSSEYNAGGEALIMEKNLSSNLSLSKEDLLIFVQKLLTKQRLPILHKVLLKNLESLLSQPGSFTSNNLGSLREAISKIERSLSKEKNSLSQSDVVSINDTISKAQKDILKKS